MCKVIDLTKIPTNPILLIDADILLYRCGFAAERKKYLVQIPDFDPIEAASYKDAKEAEKNFGGTIWERRVVEPVENALSNVDNALQGIFSEMKTDLYVMWLTGKGNFRETFATTKTYKDNRDPAHRPKHYRALKDHLVKKWNAHIVNGEEADDAIGREAYSRSIDKYIIVSNDKDLDQLSGFHYNWVTRETYFVSDEDAIKYFYVQLLAGDATDNIPGVLSYDKAKEEILALPSPHECALRSKEIYTKQFGDNWADKLEEVAELVWIRRGNKPPTDKFWNPYWEHLHSDE